MAVGFGSAEGTRVLGPGFRSGTGWRWWLDGGCWPPGFGGGSAMVGRATVVALVDGGGAVVVRVSGEEGEEFGGWVEDSGQELDRVLGRKLGWVVLG